jgi:hypothetical protein
MRKGWMALLILVGALAVHPACEVPPLMAPGSSMTLIANPPFIVANGGVSVITALLVEPAGTLVPDGTVVFFFTNLGRVDPEGQTRDGVARVNLVADARSGTATVTAFSGGTAPAPTGGGSGGGGSKTVDVVIGSANPARVLVSAPSSVRAGSSVTIVANVFDSRGNPVANVPVVFAISGGTQVFLESGGAQRFTDNNGQAFDTLITRSTSVGPIILTATTANGIGSGNITIAVVP